MIQFEPKECATLGRFANRLKILGLKKKVYFFSCPLLIKDFSFGQAVSMNGRNPTDQ